MSFTPQEFFDQVITEVDKVDKYENPRIISGPGIGTIGSDGTDVRNYHFQSGFTGRLESVSMKRGAIYLGVDFVKGS
jgi:hypothetical protein